MYGSKVNKFELIGLRSVPNQSSGVLDVNHGTGQLSGASQAMCWRWLVKRTRGWAARSQGSVVCSSSDRKSQGYSCISPNAENAVNPGSSARYYLPALSVGLRG